MDHRQAQSTKASERYLLGEMTELERFEFEGHYFECQDCAADVRAGDALARSIKVVCAEEPARRPVDNRVVAPRRGWLAWLAPGAFAPSAVAAGLAVIASYQAFVLLPGSHWRTGAGAPIVLRAAARGDEQTVEIRRDRQVSLLSLDVNSVEPGTAISSELVTPGKAVQPMDDTTAPPAGLSLIVYLRNAEIREPGPWTLVLRTKAGAEIGRYPFLVQFK